MDEAASSGGVPVLGRRLYIWQMEPDIQYASVTLSSLLVATRRTSSMSNCYVCGLPCSRCQGSRAACMHLLQNKEATDIQTNLGYTSGSALVMAALKRAF